MDKTVERRIIERLACVDWITLITSKWLITVVSEHCLLSSATSVVFRCVFAYHALSPHERDWQNDNRFLFHFEFLMGKHNDISVSFNQVCDLLKIEVSNWKMIDECFTAMDGCFLHLSAVINIMRTLRNFTRIETFIWPCTQRLNGRKLKCFHFKIYQMRNRWQIFAYRFASLKLVQQKTCRFFESSLHKMLIIYILM